ncbi:MAG: bi-domain-containing oxidoreductase [Planctomycetota bacterium]|nr:bi-domain-containing oxidoreductase [Planctomycetota bacterium]
MEQVVQNIRTGKLGVITVPEPVVQPGQILIANTCSVISAGTEKMAIDLAAMSLVGKARQRPDQVRRVLEKMRSEGFLHTLATVRDKLDEPLGLGYSSAGVVLACGAGVQGFRPSDRVASNGPHAGVVSVPKHLCAPIPSEVPIDHAAFTVLGAVALQGVRLAKLDLGETAFVIGLGLIGQLTVSVLKAGGCRVIGTDPIEARCDLALRMGADQARPLVSAREVEEATGGLGADAVLITASSRSNDPVAKAGEAVRKKGRVIAVGDVGLHLPRRSYYSKEAEIVVSCSYGPGRYDADYEERGHDYPAAHVRWTEQRNLGAILDLMATGRLDVSPLISHRFPIEKADAAYRLLEKEEEPYLGIVLEYPDRSGTTPSRSLELKAAPSSGTIGIGCIGAGRFARTTILPAIQDRHVLRLQTLCSARGLSATAVGEKFGFERVTTDEDVLFADEGVDAVFILTPHREHARQVCKGIRAGLHVFVEKPLARTIDELRQIEEALTEASERRPMLTVGFNRRFSPAARLVREAFADISSPLTISIRFNAGRIPPDHEVQDEETGGGRIIGEACHAIDLATYLAGSPPVRVFAESVGGPRAPVVTDDQCFITLRHADGSVSSVAYLAGGDRAFPKERVEVFGGGKVAVIDDFRDVLISSEGKKKRTRSLNQKKGHREELEAFIDAIARGGDAPISWDEMRAVSLASILAVRSLREGTPFDIA